MPADALPPDVYAVLDQLLTEASRAVASGDHETASSAVDSAATVTENKVPPGPQRRLLGHCCETVTDLLEAEDTDAALIREYLRATSERLVVEAGGS